MVALPLPAVDPAELKARLLDEFRIEIPITEHNGRALIRLSIQAYNTPDDTTALLHALRQLT